MLLNSLQLKLNSCVISPFARRVQSTRPGLRVSSGSPALRLNLFPHTEVATCTSGQLRTPAKTTGIQNYVLHAEIQDAVIHSVKSKHKSPVLYRWSVGHGAINAFEFSPDLTHIAIASQDGFLRLYGLSEAAVLCTDAQLLRRPPLRVLEPRW